MASRIPRAPVQAQCRVCEEWRTVRMQAGDKPAARCRSCAAANRSVLEANVIRLLAGDAPAGHTVTARRQALAVLERRAAEIRDSLE